VRAVFNHGFVGVVFMTIAYYNENDPQVAAAFIEATL